MSLIPKTKQSDSTYKVPATPHYLPQSADSKKSNRHEPAKSGKSKPDSFQGNREFSPANAKSRCDALVQGNSGNNGSGDSLRGEGEGFRIMREIQDQRNDPRLEPTRIEEDPRKNPMLKEPEMDHCPPKSSTENVSTSAELGEFRIHHPQSI